MFFSNFYFNISKAAVTARQMKINSVTMNSTDIKRNTNNTRKKTPSNLSYNVCTSRTKANIQTISAKLFMLKRSAPIWVITFHWRSKLCYGDFFFIIFFSLLFAILSLLRDRSERRKKIGKNMCTTLNIDYSVRCRWTLWAYGCICICASKHCAFFLTVDG